MCYGIAPSFYIALLALRILPNSVQWILTSLTLNSDFYTLFIIPGVYKLCLVGPIQPTTCFYKLLLEHGSGGQTLRHPCLLIFIPRSDPVPLSVGSTC